MGGCISINEFCMQESQQDRENTRVVACIICYINGIMNNLKC